MHVAAHAEPARPWWVRRPATVVIVVLAVAVALLAAPGSERDAVAQDRRSSAEAGESAAVAPAARTLRGRVRLDGRAVRGATVRLYKAGKKPGRSDALRKVRTNRKGRFRVVVPKRAGARATLYLTSRDGRVRGRPVTHDVRLVNVIGDLRRGRVVVNELTTVAAGYAMAQHTRRGRVGGVAPGIGNSAAMTRNVVSPRKGRTTPFLRRFPNGRSTQTLATVNSLASMVAACARSDRRCTRFLSLTRGPRGKRAPDTWQALATLPRNPSGAPRRLFAAVPRSPRFRPVLTEAPNAWVLALRFVGNGHEINGPGNIAFDREGKVWFNNNAEWAVDLKDVCPGLEMFKLDPFSKGRPLETYTGGGLNGAGFGIAFDPKDHIWVGNFGFTGTLCDKGPPTSNSVSEFRHDGTPVSGDLGYLDGPLSWPQGVKSTRDGDIWIANCGNDHVVRYPDGDNEASVVVDDGVPRAFDVAFNTEGNAFVTSNGGNSVYGYRPDGTPLPGSPYGEGLLDLPLGIASDRLGNTWASSSGLIPIPCDNGTTLPTPGAGDVLDGSVVRVGPDGTAKKFTGGGLTIPWGIALDGRDNVWVANFHGQRISALCGDRRAACPRKKGPGAAISPKDGYGFDGLQRSTGLQVDSSGTVWVTNNWKLVPVQVNPFGNGVVAFLGMAAPVRTPLIGTPQRP